MGRDVTAVIPYFSRDPKFKHEKPFVISFPVEHIDGAVASNYVAAPTTTTVHDLRGNTDAPLLDREGFTVLNLPTSLSYDDFASRDTVQSKYFSELRDALKKSFPQYTKFAFLEYEIRKRSEMFPGKVGAFVENPQPVLQVHADFSVHGATTKLPWYLPGSAAELLYRPCDLLNVWRPIIDQVDEWPLAFCDFRTVDPTADVLASDVVYENYIGENEVLTPSESHRWFYLSGQRKDEVFVWRNVNLPDGQKPRAFHTSFDISHDQGVAVARRESIEVRIAAFE